MLFGMYEPDGGEIFVRGKKERIYSPRYASSLSIGMVHQHFRLVSNYTVAENIILGLRINPEDVIENLNVASCQRVEILKMLYREAEILIFDEPTAVLTPQEIGSFIEIIRSLRSNGKTIILITHKLEEIKASADRCAILNRGKLIDILDVASTSTKEMARLMVGHDVSFRTEKKPAEFGEVILDVHDISVNSITGHEAVKNVSFQIHEGEVFAVAGVSGNGQNELADSIAGLLPCSSGKISISGHDITRATVRERIESGIAYIPEDRHNVGLVLDFTLRDNLPLRQ